MKKPLAVLLAAPLATATLALAQAPAEPAAPAPAPATTSAAPAPTAPEPGKPWAGRNARSGANAQIERIVEHVLAPLGLNDEQRARIDEIKAAWLERTATKREAVRGKYLEMQALQRSQGTSPAQLETTRAELLAAQADLQAEIAKLDEEVASALDPEQRATYLATREEMRARAAQAPAAPAPVAPRPAPHTGR